MNVELPAVPEPQPSTPEERVWGPWATLGLGVVVLVVLFAVLVFIIVVMAVALAVAQPGTITSIDDFTTLIDARLGLVIAVAGIGSYAVGTGLLLAVIKAKQGKSIGDYLGLKRIGWKTVFLVILITAAYLVIITVVAGLAHIPDTDTGLLAQAYQTSVWPALFWVMVVAFAPIFEEPLARGFLFEGFRRSSLGLVGAVLLTSLIWTGLHVGYSSFSLAAIFGFGIILGFVRYRTGSLWSTMLMHAFYNAVGMALLALGH